MTARLSPRPGRTRLALVVGVAHVLAVAVLCGPAAPAAPPIPTPESVLGFVPGEDGKLAGWGQVVEYLKALDAASERVRVEEVGKTTGGRPFVLATVTSERNHARLEEIRQANARLADPRGLSEDEAEQLVGEGKAIVAMAFSIHSTEVGGTLASLRLLDRLATTDDERLRAALDATVLLVLPSHNPDGTDIVAEWSARQRGTPFEGTSPPVLYHPRRSSTTCTRWAPGGRGSSCPPTSTPGSRTWTGPSWRRSTPSARTWPRGSRPRAARGW